MLGMVPAREAYREDLGMVEYWVFTLSCLHSRSQPPSLIALPIRPYGFLSCHSWCPYADIVSGYAMNPQLVMDVTVVVHEPHEEV